jgi:uncharacterized Zn finger protein (UPF0148 family)
MNPDIIICPLCGHRFDIPGNKACQTCPLNHDCGFVCCPVCGYQTVNASNSKIAVLALQWLDQENKRHPEKKSSP